MMHLLPNRRGLPAAVFSLPHVRDLLYPSSEENAVEPRAMNAPACVHFCKSTASNVLLLDAPRSPPAAFCATDGSMIMGAASPAPGIAGGKA